MFNLQCLDTNTRPCRNDKRASAGYNVLDSNLEGEVRVMLTVDVPGRGTWRLEHLVLDFNGTLAVDGVCTAEVKAALRTLTGTLKLYILTADTYGTVARECADLPAEVVAVDPLDGGAVSWPLWKSSGRSGRRRWGTGSTMPRCWHGGPGCAGPGGGGGSRAGLGRGRNKHSVAMLRKRHLVILSRGCPATALPGGFFVGG